MSTNETDGGVPIYSILVLPSTPRLARYYINENYEDANARRYEDLYLFIANLLRPPATVQLRKKIEKKLPFVVDVENNTVLELKMDRKSALDEYVKKFRSINYRKIARELREQEQDSFKESIYADKTESLVQRGLNKLFNQHRDDYLSGKG